MNESNGEELGELANSKHSKASTDSEVVGYFKGNPTHGHIANHGTQFFR
jgi:hypothetical protein